jgi:hypothetical protein
MLIVTGYPPARLPLIEALIGLRARLNHLNQRRITLGLGAFQFFRRQRKKR